MKGTKSAARYAKSLLELSVEQNNSDKIAANMQAIVSAYDENREFQLFLSSPIISAEKKISVFESLFSNFEELSVKFIRLITKNGREAQLADIAQAYLKLLKEQQGISEVILTSASPLDEATKSVILSKIKNLTKEKVELIEKTDKSLIGGFTIVMGDQKIDASIANQLYTIKQRLTK